MEASDLVRYYRNCDPGQTAQSRQTGYNNQQKQNATLATEIEQIQQRIQHTDDKINQLMCTLYGLTEAEIKMVEGI